MDMLVKYLREETGGELSYYMDGVHVGGKGNMCASISAGLFSKSSSISAVEDNCEKFLILLISSVCCCRAWYSNWTFCFSFIYSPWYHMHVFTWILVIRGIYSVFVLLSWLSSTYINFSKHRSCISSSSERVTQQPCADTSAIITIFQMLFLMDVA